MDMETSPLISPMDVKIAPDFCGWRVPATESIVVAMVEGARARQPQKDKRGRIQRDLYPAQDILWQVTC